MIVQSKSVFLHSDRVFGVAGSAIREGCLVRLGVSVCHINAIRTAFGAQSAEPHPCNRRAACHPRPQASGMAESSTFVRDAAALQEGDMGIISIYTKLIQKGWRYSPGEGSKLDANE